MIMAGCGGLCAGSFANVLIYRLPRGIQVIRGRSFCPHCRTRIRWYDNLPLVSWIALGGRCRSCRETISGRYPAVELVVAIVAAISVGYLGMTLAALWTFLFLFILLVIAIIDATSFVIPHSLTAGGLISGLVLAPLAGPGLWRAALGALLGGVVIILLIRGYRQIRGRAGMGGGDVMLLAMIGAFLGPWGVMATLGLGAGLGAIYALVRSRGRPDRFERLPFGPFLAVAATIVLLWGESLWRWNMSLYAGGIG